MRLLTHNTLRNNTEDAKGKGFPLRITPLDIRVDDPSKNLTREEEERQIAFAKNCLKMLDWSALVQVCRDDVVVVVVACHSCCVGSVRILIIELALSSTHVLSSRPLPRWASVPCHHN